MASQEAQNDEQEDEGTLSLPGGHAVPFRLVQPSDALVMGKNKRMLELLRHLDLPEQEYKQEGIKHVEVELAPQAN